ncbi:MAG: hypothetical protein IPO98_18960 [Saprospiraceae bacterium]|nr:hypothetical protein [Saprospiraceae bacterium]
MNSTLISKRLSWICFMTSIIAFSCTSTKKTTKDNITKEDVFQIQVKPFMAEVDNLGRIYVVDDKNRIINYKPDFTEQYRFADKKSGFISRIDVSNPLRIIVFYDDFNKVKILDNTLSIISELDLGDKFSDVTACTVTNDGNLWIYDPVQFKLIKIRDNGSVIFESSNVNDFGMTDVQIYDIREKGNYVVLCDKQKGFYIFDNLGQYQYQYEASDIKHFQFDGRNINYFTGTGMKSYSVKFKERMLIGTPFASGKPGLKYVIYSGGDFYEINENGINVVKASKNETQK